jgi:hypothetical protein
LGPREPPIELFADPRSNCQTEKRARLLAAADTGKRKEKIKLAAAVAIFLSAGGVAWFMLGGDSVADTAARRIFICAETNQSFDHTVAAGEEEPIYSPFTKKKTAFEAEACYWVKPDNENGDWTKAKTKPTYVLWKKRGPYVVWKYGPDAEPPDESTICPDCGHEVVGHNPKPPPELMEAAKAEGR